MLPLAHRGECSGITLGIDPQGFDHRLYPLAFGGEVAAPALARKLIEHHPIFPLFDGPPGAVAPVMADIDRREPLGRRGAAVGLYGIGIIDAARAVGIGLDVIGHRG